MKKLMITSFMLIFAIVAFGQAKKLSKSFSNVKTIQIKTSSSDIYLKRSDDANVKLDLSYTYDADEYTPQMDENSGKLIISEEFSRGSHSGSSTWNLTVPQNVKVNINSGSGNITIEELSADIKSSLGSGDVEVKSLKGNLNMNTGSGNINVQKIQGDVSLNAGSGDIRIESGSGSFSVNAGSGTLVLEQIQGDISANTGSGDIRASALTLEGKSKFNTGSGDATVSLSKTLDHDISVNSGSGDATLDFNGSEISGEVIMTANKKNGDIVAPFKFDTEETLDDDNNSSPRIQKTARLGTKDIKIKIGTGSGTAAIK